MHNDTGHDSEKRPEILRAQLRAHMTPQRAAAQQAEDMAGRPDEDGMMYSPRVFVGICLGMAVFAAFTYYQTGALSTTILRTIVAGVLLQSAYFIAVVYLVMRRVKARTAAIHERRAQETEISPEGNQSAPPEPF